MNVPAERRPRTETDGTGTPTMGLDNGNTTTPFEPAGPPSERVVRIVAWLEGVEPTALSPLGATVDADALDRLFDAERRDDVEVRFEFEGYDVRIERGGSITVDGIDRSVGNSLPPGTNALLLAPADSECGGEACNDLLGVRPRRRDTLGKPRREVAPRDGVNVLGVTFDSAATSPLDRWDFEAGAPRRTGLIAVGGFTRGATVSSTDRAPTPLGKMQIDAVSDPSDLQALGMRINERLSSWDAPDSNSVVCFDSVSDLLEVAELQRLFRFLHLLTGWLSSKGVVAHFHLDPDAHDESAVNTLRSLFDVTFEVGQGVDGETCALHVP